LLYAFDDAGADDVTTNSKVLFNHVVKYRPPMTTAQLDRTFAALADPTRRAILKRLATGEATVNELAEPFPVSVQAVSKHLKVLEGAGLITRGRSGQLRPSRIDGAALREAAEWIDGYSSFWERGFERMERRLGG